MPRRSRRLALACFAEAARADAAQVTVVSPGGAEQTLSLDALAGSEDVAGRAYVAALLRGESTRTLNGFSLAAILEAAGADPFGFSYLEVQRPAGGSVLLSRDQALDAGAFADGPPVVYATAAGTGFLRPSSGPDDLNAGDSFEAPQGLTFVLRKGAPLQVRARGLDRRARDPASRSTSAPSSSAPAPASNSPTPGTSTTGTRPTGPARSHSFAKRGSYDVVVGVTTQATDAGASDVVTVQVGAPTRRARIAREAAPTRTPTAPDHGAGDRPSGDGASGSPARRCAAPAAERNPLLAAAGSRRRSRGAGQRRTARRLSPTPPMPSR